MNVQLIAISASGVTSLTAGGLQPLGCGPLVNCSEPDCPKWRVSEYTSPLVWAASKHVQVYSTSGNGECAWPPLMQMELCACTRLPEWNHSLSLHLLVHKGWGSMSYFIQLPLKFSAYEISQFLSYMQHSMAKTVTTSKTTKQLLLIPCKPLPFPRY